MKRGFTLLELMCVVSIMTIVMASVGAFYLEFRVAAARTEAEVSMNREASLALEWLARDAAGADRIDGDPLGATIARGEERIRWEVGERGLLRTAARSRIIAPRATQLAVETTPAGERFFITSERKLLRGRAARVVRSAFVARRR
jgi:prepilin-type N-terminal cleavage/methylation domain-containing protein